MNTQYTKPAAVKPPKIRLDQLVFDRGLAASRSQAQAMILAGQVLVKDEKIDKPGTKIRQDLPIRIKGQKLPYVSRGGLKLAGALEKFNLNLESRPLAMDIGASTGGFSDCLLQKGVHKVYAIDVGTNQLDWKLRQDQRIISLEKTNFRYLTKEDLPVEVDLITIDASFISLKLLLPNTLNFLKAGGIVLALIKPQFEVGRGEVGKNGVVKDEALHLRVQQEMENFADSLGFRVLGLCESPIQGPQGNREFFISLEC